MSEPNANAIPSTRAANRSRTHKLTISAMLSGVAFLLMFIEFPIPALIPSFVKLDVSDLPELLAAFSLGPVYGIVVTFLKNLLFSVLHECGHLTALCALGLQPRQLRLSFYGMALRYDRVPDRRRETAVLFGGPAVNLILWVLLRNPANGALFLLNMLPIFPLDGGRLAALWLPQRLAAVLSALALAVLTGLGGYVLYRGGGVSLLGISLYLMLSNLRSV